MAVGLILVAPTYVQCAGAAEGLAACLRGHIIEAGVLPGPAQPQTELDVPPAPVGTLDAEAAVVAAPSPVGAALTPPTGNVVVEQGLGTSPDLGGTVVLAPLRGSLSAVTAPPPSAEVPAAALAPSPPPTAESDPAVTGTIGTSGQVTSTDRPAAGVSLIAMPGQLSADVAGQASPAIAAVDLAAVPSKVALSATTTSVPPSSVRISPTPGSLHLAASEPVGSGTPYIATLAAPSGLVTMSQSLPPATQSGPPVDLAAVQEAGQQVGTLNARSGESASSGNAATVTLTAEVAEPQGQLAVAQPDKALSVPPTVVTVTPAPYQTLAPTAPPPVEATPPDDPPAVRVFIEDPRYPSVTLLPPPSTGENSSIITLQLIN